MLNNIIFAHLFGRYKEKYIPLPQISEMKDFHYQGKST